MLGRLLALLFVATVAAPLRATWSIIIIDTRTGEIAIASATCLTSFDLKAGACVVVVGRGAAAAQSFVDLTGANRILIWTQLHAGTAPAQIMTMLASSDPSHQTRQYGIADVQGRTIAFTGTGAGQWAGHLTGQIGTLVYAVQGNVLTGLPVITAAEQALRNTNGDLAERLMAAMEAARAMGGDGRCSCNVSNPTACGSPPATFTKSADIGYLLIARPGDMDGICSASAGCANGVYYLDENVAFQQSNSPDPVLQLRTRFQNWRLRKVLRPDHFLSEVTMEPATLLGDGFTRATLRVRLRDWRNVPIPYGGSLLTATVLPGGVPVVLGTVTDHGDGTFSLPVTAGNQVGSARVRFVVDDGLGPVQLGPDTEIRMTNDSLWLDRENLIASQPQALQFALDAGPARAGRAYLLLGGLSGSSPGYVLGPNVTLPLNPDPFTTWLAQLSISLQVPGLFGQLDAQGRVRPRVVVPAGALASLQGAEMTLAFTVLQPSDFASNPVFMRIRL